ncbi:tetratricopeptide repeat protein [Pseudomonas sp.]|uniref:tetratricopeptide repeat protein n=1 Tax=Pseudomonas sp. TaxID=306 RepID=UPI00260808DE|nr:tetratricopeptide repeat protein [Pseudomonas sp.]
MQIAFVVALVLAWPTFGLSVLCWAVCFYVFGRKKTKARIPKADLAAVEAVFQHEYADFFKALDVPYLQGAVITDGEAEQCGRHIKNYIAGNPPEIGLFFKGLAKWRTKGGDAYASPAIAAGEEFKFNLKEHVHGVSYRAIEALMINNPGLRCFKSVNLAMVSQYVHAGDAGGASSSVNNIQSVSSHASAEAVAYFKEAQESYDPHNFAHDANPTAIYLYLKAAELGHLEAQFRLGSIYLGKSDSRNALRWLPKAAEKGHIGAYYKLGNLYSRKNDPQALIWYCKAAESGSVEAMISLGHMYAQGHIVPQDLPQAAAWHQKAAELGSVESQLRLGRMYKEAAGLEPDQAKADFWLGMAFAGYLKLAEEGDADSQCMLGCLYVEGEGVAEDYAQARYWFKQAILQGDAQANEMMMMYGFDE